MTKQAATSLALGALVVLYAVARVLQVFPGKIPALAIISVQVLTPIVFASVHGARFYRFRGIVVFCSICLIVGNSFENLSIRTGFPFGHYSFTDLMGPKLFQVPVLLGLAYVGMGYLSWTLGSLILGAISMGSPLAGSRIVTLPLLAAFIMVAWDISNDAIWSTIERAWLWREGGVYFGVPISNFLGWYLTVYIIYQLFALYLRGRSFDSDPFPPNFWRLAILFYAVSAAGNILLVIPSNAPAIVTDGSGMQWNAGHIAAACALVPVFTMGGFALFAWLRLGGRGDDAIVEANRG